MSRKPKSARAPLFDPPIRGTGALSPKDIPTSSGRPRLAGLKPGEWKCESGKADRHGRWVPCGWIGIPRKDANDDDVCARCGSVDIFDDEPDEEDTGGRLNGGWE